MGKVKSNFIALKHNIKNTIANDQKTGLGIPRRINDILSYLIIIYSVVMLFMRRNDLETREVAGQAIILQVAAIIFATLGEVLGNIFLVGFIFELGFGLLGLITFLIIAFLIIRSAQGRRIRLPLIEDLVDIFIK